MNQVEMGSRERLAVNGWKRKHSYTAGYRKNDGDEGNVMQASDNDEWVGRKNYVK